ncbi:uncharacterized protein [Rutidosis leptorrhynchoides]|uniref:uncharacterized protein n=1 Tax=Rutidosis leptorrhynchoides TaxID=125765 RepID=UPI003A99B15B
MKAISLNIRSFKVGGKVDVVGWVRRLIVKEKPSFMALQETKLHLVDLNWIQSLWGSGNCNFIQKEMVGKSGGQLLIWDTIEFEAIDVINADFFMGVKGVWKSSGVSFNIVNVYGPHDDNNKKSLWNSLHNLIDASDEAWLLCGDFNEVRNQNERLNCDFIDHRARLFNDFITINSLIEIPLGGRNFTRVSDDGTKFSKIDCFLVNQSFVNLWKDLTAIALDRQHSDHCPIVLKDEDRNFGPKPFKIFDAWLDDEEIESVIRDAWVLPVENNARKDCVFRNKLKNVKNALRTWSNGKYKNLDVEIENLRSVAMEFELQAENGPLIRPDLDLWRETRKKWADKERTKELIDFK